MKSIFTETKCLIDHVKWVLWWMWCFFSNIPTQSSDIASAWEERRTSVLISAISMKKSTLDLSQISLWHVPTSIFISSKVCFILLKYLLPFRWLMAIFYLSFIIIVPFCYIKIYRYRRNLIVPGFGQRTAETTKFRKSRNIVTFAYNITIWIVEAVSTFIVVFLFLYKTPSVIPSAFLGHVVRRSNRGLRVEQSGQDWLHHRDMRPHPGPLHHGHEGRHSQGRPGESVVQTVVYRIT